MNQIQEALEMASQALYEAVMIAPKDRLPEKAAGAKQQIDYVLTALKSGKLEIRKGGVCEWSNQEPLDGEESCWNTCGVEWGLNWGTPSENGMKYCPICGRKLVEDLTGQEATNDNPRT